MGFVRVKRLPRRRYVLSKKEKITIFKGCFFNKETGFYTGNVRRLRLCSAVNSFVDYRRQKPPLHPNLDVRLQTKPNQTV